MEEIEGSWLILLLLEKPTLRSSVSSETKIIFKSLFFFSGLLFKTESSATCRAMSVLFSSEQKNQQTRTSGSGRLLIEQESFWKTGMNINFLIKRQLCLVCLRMAVTQTADVLCWTWRRSRSREETAIRTEPTSFAQQAKLIQKFFFLLKYDCW